MNSLIEARSPRSPHPRIDFDSISRFIVTRSTEIFPNQECQLVISSNGHNKMEQSNQIEIEDKSWPNRIPLFGLLMSFLSVICFSLASLIVKIVTDLHALEILAIRFAILLF